MSAQSCQSWRSRLFQRASRSMVLALWASASAACLTQPAPPDTFAGVVGATVLGDGSIVVLPAAAKGPGELDGGLTIDPSVDAAWPEGDGAPPATDAAPPAGCDLRGRWLVTDRSSVASGDIRQLSVSWYYYELEQGARELVVKRGLTCGRTTRPLGPLGANGDLSGQFPALIARQRHDGRTATVSAVSGGCRVEFPKFITVGGATVDYYRDPSRALPGVDQPATDTTPGWEDWDGDGHPGVAVKVSSSVIRGTVHSCDRSWTSWSGTIAADSRSFTLAGKPGFTQRTLEVDGPPLLTGSGTTDPDPSAHFAAFVKLDDTQATASNELALCAEIRDLSPELSPDANQ